MPNERVEVAGLPFDNLTIEQARDRVLELACGERCAMVVTPNAEIAQLCLDKPDIRALMREADLIIPDGAGVILASKILGRRLKGRVPGFELAGALLPECARLGIPLFLLGAAPGIAQEAAERMKAMNPGLIISDMQDGYFKDAGEVIDKINSSRARIVFVCLGAPKQERFMHEHREAVDAGVMLGLGGSLDAFAGRVKRAPQIFRKTGMEWFYRLCRQPSRIGRMMKLPKYIFSAIFIRLGWKKI